nr:unnamed protein product [Callosobruchus chinensis]
MLLVTSLSSTGIQTDFASPS